MSNVTVFQTPEGFRLSAEIQNTGNIASKDGSATLKAEFNDLYSEGLEGTWLELPVEALEPGQSIAVDELLDIDDVFLKHGFANGFADLVDENSEALMVGCDFIAALEYPYHITVNDDPNLEVIELKAGESIELSGTYGPTDYYRNATVEFTTADGEMVHMEGNTLVADEAGETYLRVYDAPFGGVKLIRLRISSENKPLDSEPADDKKPADSRNATTADSNNIPLYTGILGASLLAAIALIMYRRKQTN